MLIRTLLSYDMSGGTTALECAFCNLAHSRAMSGDIRLKVSINSCNATDETDF